MKFASFIARRYMLRGRRYSYISVISLVSILGIAIGVAALVIALSLVNGFQRDIRDRIVSSSAHLIVSAPFQQGIEDYRRVADRIAASVPGVRSVTAVVHETVMVRGEGKAISGGVLRGTELERSQGEPWLNGLQGKLPRSEGELIMGADMADRLFVADPRDGLIQLPVDCLVVIPRAVASPVGVSPFFKKFRVTGIFRSGLYEFDNNVMITGLRSAQKLFRLDDQVSYLHVYLQDIFQADAAARQMREWLPMSGLSVTTWKELNAELYSALRLEKTVLFLTLTLIVIVASLNIVAGLFLMVIQKIRDIGILLSYGATPALIRRIFFLQGTVIGVIGTVLGLGIGLLVCYLANRFRLIPIPAEFRQFYQISHLRFLVNGLDTLAIAAVSLLISALATRLPARRAAQISVVDAVKYE